MRSAETSTGPIVDSPHGPVDVHTGELLSPAAKAVRGGDATALGPEPGVLSRVEARQVTEAIRATSELLYVLLARAHAGKAWRALGYRSFEQYVRAEFDMSRSRAYQILDQARVIEALEAVLPEASAPLALSESVTRDLKTLLPQVVAAIEQHIAEPTAHGKNIEDLIEEFRDQARGASGRHPHHGANDASKPATGTGTIPAAWRPDQVERAAFDLCASIGALGTMPEVTALIAHIPADRHPQIDEALDRVMRWLQQFAQAWSTRQVG